MFSARITRRLSVNGEGCWFEGLEMSEVICLRSVVTSSSFRLWPSNNMFEIEVISLLRYAPRTGSSSKNSDCCSRGLKETSIWSRRIGRSVGCPLEPAISSVRLLLDCEVLFSLRSGSRCLVWEFLFFVDFLPYFCPSKNVRHN